MISAVGSQQEGFESSLEPFCVEFAVLTERESMHGFSLSTQLPSTETFSDEASGNSRWVRCICEVFTCFFYRAHKLFKTFGVNNQGL